MRAPRRTFLGTLAAAVPAKGLGRELVPAAPPQAGMAEGLLAAARARFAHHLGPDEVDEVRKGIESLLRSCGKLQGFSLGNAEEPVLTFDARPGRPGSTRR